MLKDDDIDVGRGFDPDKLLKALQEPDEEDWIFDDGSDWQPLSLKENLWVALLILIGLGVWGHLIYLFFFR